MPAKIDKYQEQKLVELSVEYVNCVRRMAEIANEVEEIVLPIGETQVIGLFRARYHSATRSVSLSDARGMPGVTPELIEKYTKKIPSISWSAIIEEAGINREDLPAEDRAAYVTVHYEG